MTEPEGNVFQNAGGNAKAAPESTLLQAAREAVRAGRSPRANADMRIPPRYRGKTLWGFSFDNEAISKKAERAKEALLDGGSLFLTGAPGCGKTHLATALMCEWCAANLAESGGVPHHAKGPPLFVPAVELLAGIKRAWDEGGAEHAVMERLFRTPVLVIDDLGAERASDWSRQVFYSVIDRRYREGSQVIITSNLDLERLDRSLDGRIASRLCEMGPVIDMGRADWRAEARRRAASGV